MALPAEPFAVKAGGAAHVVPLAVPKPVVPVTEEVIPATAPEDKAP